MRSFCHEPFRGTVNESFEFPGSLGVSPWAPLGSCLERRRKRTLPRPAPRWEKGRKELERCESAPLGSRTARRGVTLGSGPGAAGRLGGAARARRGRSRARRPRRFPGPAAATERLAGLGHGRRGGAAGGRAAGLHGVPGLEHSAASLRLRPAQPAGYARARIRPPGR